MGNESSCRKPAASAAGDPRRTGCASIATVSPSPYGIDSPTSPDKGDTTTYGVAEKRGGGILRNGRVERWHALVCPARMDMDRFGVCVREDGDAKSIMAAGIFDGHGIAGSRTWAPDIAEAAAKAICRGAIEWCLCDDDDVANTQSSSEQRDVSNLLAVFEKFQQRHRERYEEHIMAPFDSARRQFEEENGFSPGPRTLPAEGGTTATVVIVAGDELFVAWVGDSRAVLCREEETHHGRYAPRTIALTLDHNISSNEAESDRCEAAGGLVFGKFVGSCTADGMLQVTRSLGDYAHHEAGVVLSTPQTLCLPLSTGDCFVVIASDGIWETLPQTEVIRILYHTISSTVDCKPDLKQKALEAAVRDVMDQANDVVRNRGIRADDCSMVVLVFARSKTDLNDSEAPESGIPSAPLVPCTSSAQPSTPTSISTTENSAPPR